MLERSLDDELFDAVERKDLGKCKELLALGADVNGHAGKIPLVRACSFGRIDLCKVLIDAGADINIMEGDPLLGAAISGHTEVCRFLFAAGVDIQHQRSTGWTSLHGAATAGKLEVCRVLIDAGMDVNAVTLNGRTALSEAVRRGNAEVARFLVQAGAHWAVSVPDDRYETLTPFQLAVRHGHESIVNDFLSVHREDPAQRTAGGMTMIALAGKHAGIKQALRSAKAALAVERSLAPELRDESPRPECSGRSGMSPI